MKSLIEWLNRIIKKQKALKRWQRIVTVLAAMITFVTTYALILPAITVERDNTDVVGGMYLEQEEEQDDMLEENALEPIGFSIAADQENAVAYAYSDDDMTATAIFSTDEEIPEGAELVVNLVDSESEEYTDLSSRSLELLDKEFIYDVTTCSFYDFALVCDNVDVTPESGLVDLQIIFRNNTVEHVNDAVYAGRYVRPISLSDGFTEITAEDGTATAETDEADDDFAAARTLEADNTVEGAGYASDAEDELVSVNPDESSVIELTDGIITVLTLKGNDLVNNESIVGILAGYVDEEVKAAAAEMDAEIPEHDNLQDEDALVEHEEVDEEKAAPAMKTLEAAGSDYTVILTYDATSGIPEEAALTVSEIAQDSEEYQTYLEETKKAMGLTEEETLPHCAARFFDIKIMVGDEEFTLESGVSVEITYAEPLAEKTDAEVSAVHFADENAEAEVIEASASEVQDGGVATVGFTAESFSVYGVVYTVDFYWEVNGKTYEFNLPGGGFVSFRQLAELLGIAATPDPLDSSEIAAAEVTEVSEGETVGTDTNLIDNAVENGSLAIKDVVVSEKTREFVADIEKIEFSDSSLLWVGKIDGASTVGQIKADQDLEVQYSAELTEEQIEEINATEVESGDWALISIQPFTSEEILTVTMKTGEIFDIRVTDVMDDTRPYEQGTPFTAYDTREDGFVINLFDYGPETAQNGVGLDNGGTNLQSKGGAYYSGINNGHDLKFLAYGTKPSEVQTNYQDVLTLNHFSGTEAATQGIVEKQLSGRFPKLNGGESLAYLFNTTPDGNNKRVYQNVAGLFQKDDDGKYFYDSNVNYAYYDPAQQNGGLFQLCDTFPEEGDNGRVWGVGFFPFNPWNGNRNCIHWSDWCPPSNQQNRNYYYNHHFGLTLDGSFQMTPSGKLNGEDMVFNFSGDDDLWVFIDDVLVLDIGGIHNPVGGSINFRTGDVIVESAYQVNQVIDDDVAGPAATTTIAQRFADAGKVWDPSPYSEHTIRVFYLERGGCYSNCRMEFNLTRFKHLEFDKKDQYNVAVENAEFALFHEDGAPLMETYLDDNNQFQERPYVRYSDENGHVLFDYVPAGTYYLRETSVPEGYLAEQPEYKAKIVVTNNQDGTYTVDSYTLKNGQAAGTLLNYKNREIDISIEKEWPGGAPNGVTATFVLQRRRSYEADVPLRDSKIVLYRIGFDRNTNTWDFDNLIYLGERTYAGNSTATVNWTYSSYYGSEWIRWEYYVDDTFISEGNSSQKSIYLPAGETVTVYICDGNVGTQYENYGVTGYSVNGTPPNPNATIHISVTDEEDTGFNNNNPPTYTFPAGTTDWEYTFPSQYALGLNEDGILETYTYYVKEVPPLPTGYDVVYDRMDGEIIEGSSESETRIIYNIKKTNVPLQKAWNWSKSDNNNIESWTATFKLQYREVYESGEPDSAQNVQSLWGYVYDGDNVREVTISEGNDINNGSGSFSDLPMYRVHANGSVYRLVYAVEEAEYTINYVGGGSSSWSRETSGAFEEHYSPIYTEDAGQTSEPYSISVINSPSSSREQNTIDMDIEKLWEGDDGTIAADPDNYATFRLKRYYHDEYLILTGYNENDLVKVTLDFGNGKKSVLEVPRNAPVFITADVKSEGTVNLTFNQTVPSGSSGSRSLYYDPDDPGTGNYTHTDAPDGPVVFVFSDVITADQNQTWTLQTPSDSEPFIYILGGDQGIRPATFDYSTDGSQILPDVTAEIFDSAFTISDPLGQEFDLNSGNHWTKGWDKLPQVVEVRNTTEDGPNSVSYLTTVVYSYYLEEVECYPSDYYAVFRDHDSGERYGDVTARVEASGLMIDAINKLAPETQLYKVDIAKLGGTINPDEDLLAGAAFSVKKYVKFAEEPGEVEELDTKWGSGGVKTATFVDPDPDDETSLLDNGKFKVGGLVPGYYEIDETEYPTGYIKLDDNPRFQVVLDPETETLMIVPWNSDETIAVIDATTDDPNIIVVGNKPGAVLPKTGGAGIEPFYLLGLALMCLAGAGLIIKRRTRNAA